MLEKLKLYLSPIFEEEEQAYGPSVRFGSLLVWFAVAGIIGGLASLTRATNHAGLVSAFTSVIFIILTAKPLSKWLVKPLS